MKNYFPIFLILFLSGPIFSLPGQNKTNVSEPIKIHLSKNIDFSKEEEIEIPIQITEIPDPENRDEIISFNLQEIPPNSLVLYRNKKVDQYIRFYLGRYRKKFIEGLIRGKQYFPIFRKTFKEENLPEELIYLSVIESNINPSATSHARAAGIWQFMKHTGRAYGLESSWWKDERRDVFKSTEAAAKHLKDLHQKYGSWELALAAYNAGSGKINRAIKAQKRKNLPTDYYSLKLPRETKNYVPQFLAVANIIKNHQKYGLASSLFVDVPYPKFKSIQVPQGVSFTQISRKLGIPLKQLHLLNPQYFRKYTSLEHSKNLIRIPESYTVNESALASIKKDLHGRSLIHRVRSGESLWTISRKYAVSILSIRNFNPKLYNRKYLKPGMKLIIPDKQSRSRIASNDSGERSGNKIYHRVRRGDSLIKIAKRYKVNLENIIKSNASIQSKNDIIRVGMKLKIPATQ